MKYRIDRKDDQYEARKLSIITDKAMFRITEDRGSLRINKCGIGMNKDSIVLSPYASNEVTIR